MRVLSEMKIGKRVALACIIPMFGILFLAAEVALKDYFAYSKTQKLHEAIGIVTELSELTHRLQVERGRSAGFVGSKGTKVVPDSLQQARKSVDEELLTFQKLSVHFKSIATAEIRNDLSVLEQDIASVPSFREQINNQELDASEVLSFYSKMIEHIFSIGFHSAEFSTDPKISVSILAMLNLGEVKELAGKERGLVNGALASNQFSLTHRRAYYGLIATQERLIKNFINSEPEDVRQKYRDQLAKSGVEELEQLRKLISASSHNLSVSGVEPANWFEKATIRINKLREIELNVARDIVTKTDGVLNSALKSMALSSGISILILIFACIGGYVVSGTITKPLSNLVASIRGIIDGDLKSEVPGQGMNNEIGSIADAVSLFRDNAVEKLEMEQDAKVRALEESTRRSERDAEKAAADSETRRIVEVLGFAMERLAEGDLTSRIEDPFGQGLDGLRTSYNSAIEKLSEALGQITESIYSVRNTAGEMRSATEQLSTRTEEQAKSLQEASASIEEITATVKNSARDAQSAAQRAQIATDDAHSSRAVVQSAVDSMTRIEEASKEIASIIGVIDEIGFQTNLLALNAGVEAARAGESGKGFAVVAQEVRELAQRSNDAAQDIKKLIATSSNEVEDGVKNVTATGEVLTNISGHVSEISEFIGSIATSTGEQSIGLDECNRSVTQIDHSTQQNAAMAEETTAVTETLASNATQLAELVSRFKVRDDQIDDVNSPRVAA